MPIKTMAGALRKARHFAKRFAVSSNFGLDAEFRKAALTAFLVGRKLCADMTDEITEKEFKAIMTWICNTTINCGLLSNCLESKLAIGIDKDGDVTFSMTEVGRKYVETEMTQDTEQWYAHLEQRCEGVPLCVFCVLEAKPKTEAEQ